MYPIIFEFMEAKSLLVANGSKQLPMSGTRTSAGSGVVAVCIGAMMHEWH